MNLNNIYNQEHFIARNIQERARTKRPREQEAHQHKPLLPAIKHLFGRRDARMKRGEQV